jgi:hypothetical protein
MSTEVLQILKSVRALSLEDRRDLAKALEAEPLAIPAGPDKTLIRSVRGKYAYVPTSSDAFIARKREELASEH